MKRKFLSILLVFCMTLTLLPTAALADEGTVAKAETANGIVEYATLVEAVRNVKDGGTVTLLKSSMGGGIGLYEDPKTDQNGEQQIKVKNFTIDFAGYTYTCEAPAVGSDGFESQGVHLEWTGDADTNVNVTLKNGTLTSKVGSGVKMLVQNYCNLTLESMTLDGSKLDKSNVGFYTLSNCCGKVTVKDTTIIAHNKEENSGGLNGSAFAFDVDYKGEKYPAGAHVSVLGDSVINGAIEVTANQNSSLTITDGTFSTDVSQYIDTNIYEAVNVDDAYVVAMSKNGYADHPEKAVATTTLGEYNSYYYFSSLPTAVRHVKDGSTVSLERDVSYGGIRFDTSKKSMTLDLNGHTYTVADPLVGSSGTRTNGFQLLRGGKFAIVSDSEMAGRIVFKEGARFGIKNYCDLTINNVELISEAATTTISNCGKLTVLGEKTKITCPDTNWAITTGNYIKGDEIVTDIQAGEVSSLACETPVWEISYNGTKATEDESVTTNISGGKIEKVGVYDWRAEYGEDYANAPILKNWKMNIRGGEIKTLALDDESKGHVSITNGTFGIDPSAFLAAGYCVKNDNSLYVVGVHKLEMVEAKEATCTESGNSAYYNCENCGIYKDADGKEPGTVAEVTIKAKGHTMTKTEAKAATCKETGNVAYYTCSVCGNVYEDEQGNTPITVGQTVTKIDQTNHQYKTQVAEKVSTCTENGWDAYETCACGAILVNGSNVESIPYREKTAHSWDNGVVTTKPMESSKGVKTFTCTVCQATKTEEIPELGHQHHLDAGRRNFCDLYCGGCG